MNPGKITTELTRFILPVSLAFLILSGCARPRWSEPLEDEENTEVAGIITAMQEADKSCPDSFDGDALIFWKSPLNDTGVSGYLQLLAPSFVKFIISNPLGQPVYAFASNGITFQSLNTRQRLHIRGNVRTLAIRQELPLVLAQGDWFAYLSGRLPARSLGILEVYRDNSDKTVWMLLAPLDSAKTLDKAWVHLDPEKRTVLGYLFLDRDGKTLAELSYNNQEERTDYCMPNEKIILTDLPWGSEIRIELKDIRTDTNYRVTDFSLPVPSGYARQLRP